MMVPEPFANNGDPRSGRTRVVLFHLEAVFSSYNRLRLLSGKRLKQKIKKPFLKSNDTSSIGSSWGLNLDDTTHFRVEVLLLLL
jgi:hypothetical protein